MGAKHVPGSETTSISVPSPCRDRGAVRVRAASDTVPTWSWHTIRARTSGEGLEPGAGMMRPFTPTTTRARSFPKGRMDTKPFLTSQVAVEAAKPTICWFAMLPRSVDVKSWEDAAVPAGSAKSAPAHSARSTRCMIDPSCFPIVCRSDAPGVRRALDSRQSVGREKECFLVGECRGATRRDVRSMTPAAVEAALGRETLDEPPVAVSPVGDAVVQAVLAALPELEGVRVDQVASPEGRAP